MHVPLRAAVLVIVRAAAVHGLIVVQAGAREPIAPLSEGVDEAGTILLAKHCKGGREGVQYEKVRDQERV